VSSHSAKRAVFHRPTALFAAIAVLFPYQRIQTIIKFVSKLSKLIMFVNMIY
jgi:hypothetical protein